MNFSEFIKRNAKEDNATGSYTRYVLAYSEKLDMPVVVELKNKDHVLKINLYETDLPTRKRGIKFEDYANDIMTKYFENTEEDFEIGEEPVAQLSSTMFGNKPVIQTVSVIDDKEYVRKGLGTYMLRLAQDYYAKTLLGGEDNYQDRIYAAKNNYDRHTVYQTRLERKLGKVGAILSHARAKVQGPQPNIAFNTFLARNGYNVIDHVGQIPYKNLRIRNEFDNSLLNDEEKRPLIDVFGEVVDLTDKITYREEMQK